MTRRAAIRVLSLLACTAGLMAFWRSLPAPSDPPQGSRVESFREELALREPARLKSPRYRSEPMIRVGLTESPVRSLTLEISGAYRIQPVGETRVLKRGRSLAATRVTSSETGLVLGSESLPSRQIEIIPEKTAPSVWINDHQYRGRVLLYRRGGNKVLAVNLLPLEQYIASVVDSEMPAAFPVEARRAQAIVARTYAIYQR
ncbi:MAG: hypothetical protein EHM42_05290, partial [Planctomycetaceae bacterium]